MSPTYAQLRGLVFDAHRLLAAGNPREAQDILAPFAKRGWAGSCPICLNDFRSVRPDARFCSKACKQKAFRKRQKEAKQ